MKIVFQFRNCGSGRFLTSKSVFSIRYFNNQKLAISWPEDLQKRENVDRSRDYFACRCIRCEDWTGK